MWFNASPPTRGGAHKPACAADLGDKERTATISTNGFKFNGLYQEPGGIVRHHSTESPKDLVILLKKLSGKKHESC